MIQISPYRPPGYVPSVGDASSLSRPGSWGSSTAVILKVWSEEPRSLTHFPGTHSDLPFPIMYTRKASFPLRTSIKRTYGNALNEAADMNTQLPFIKPDILKGFQRYKTILLFKNFCVLKNIVICPSKMLFMLTCDRFMMLFLNELGYV